ncbi:MAG: hypothetical protein C5B49_13845 [Bdellovibrio sp.]|nr:MAG: hypothetical protein C5B49_13845 [Bdellovibrio sp.]
MKDQSQGLCRRLLIGFLALVFMFSVAGLTSSAKDLSAAGFAIDRLLLFFSPAVLSLVMALGWVALQRLPMRRERQALESGQKAFEKQREEFNQAVYEQNLRLLGSSRLNSLGEMAGNIAHEINNPMAVISMLAQRLRLQAQSGKLDLAKLIESADKIELTCVRIATIIRGLRLCSRNGIADPMVRENVGSIIQDVSSLCAETLKAKKIRLEIECDEELELVCQPVRISQALLNLLVNAKDALQAVADRWIHIQARIENDLVYITVTDSGRGIPAQLRSRIMEPFFTTKPPGKGTGLGLSISKDIAEHHGGTLFLNNEHPQTQFVLVFPAAGQPDAQVAPLSSPSIPDLLMNS